MIGTGFDSLILSGLLIVLAGLGTAVRSSTGAPPTPYKTGIKATLVAGVTIGAYQLFVINNGAAVIETAGILGAAVAAVGGARMTVLQQAS